MIYKHIQYIKQAPLLACIGYGQRDIQHLISSCFYLRINKSKQNNTPISVTDSYQWKRNQFKCIWYPNHKLLSLAAF